MKNILHKINIESILQFFGYPFLFLMPLQTIWIFQERFLDGIKLEYSTIGLYATEILLFACALFFIIFYIKNYISTGAFHQPFKFTIDRQLAISLLAFIIYLSISIFLAQDKSIALQSAARVIEAIFLFLIFYIGPFELRKIIFYFVAGAVCASCFGIFQFFSQYVFKSSLLGLAEHAPWQIGASVIVNETGRWLRAYSTFSHPNIFGGYLIISVLFLFILISLNFNQWNTLKKVVSFSSLLILLAGIMCSLSRSSLLALVPAFVAPFVIFKNHIEKKAIIFVFALFALFSALFLPILATRFFQKSYNEAVSVSERIVGYKMAVEVIKNNLFFGVGIGNYTDYILKHYNGFYPWEYQPVHSAPALFVSELGFVGILLIILVLSVFFRFWAASFESAIYKKNMLLFSFLLFLSFVFLLSFDHYLFSSYIGMLMSAIYAVVYMKATAFIFHK
jgi:hypothetical protein